MVDSPQHTKKQLVDALKDVRNHVDELKTEHALRNRLLKLIFKLVERNQSDEDVLFWASFVLLHVSNLNLYVL